MPKPSTLTQSLLPRFGARLLISRFTLIICITIGISACGSLPDRQSPATSTLNFNKSSGTKSQQTAISQHFKIWANTPYKLGGLSKSGIDCSGFVHVTFREVFRKNLPRSTELQAQKGKNVSKESLKFGDLVFFKTGRRLRHVGIYINKGKFIHASSSRGVMQSSLHSTYWSRNYWKAKRIL